MVDRGEPDRQEPVAGRGEQKTRRAERIAREITRHRDRRARQQQTSETRRESFERIRQRRGRARQIGAEHALRHDLDQDVDRGDATHRAEQSDRHRPRRRAHLAADAERRLHAGESEDREEHRAAESRPPRGPMRSSDSPGRIRNAPTARNTSSGISFAMVVTPTRRAPGAAPAMFTTASSA